MILVSPFREFDRTPRTPPGYKPGRGLPSNSLCTICNARTYIPLAGPRNLRSLTEAPSRPRTRKLDKVIHTSYHYSHNQHAGGPDWTMASFFSTGQQVRLLEVYLNEGQLKIALTHCMYS